MVERRQIEEFANEIARRYSPEKIILFGSQARGTAREDSDTDLLILMDFEGSPAFVRADIREHVPFPHRLDLVVRRPADTAWRIAQNDFFLKEVMATGVVLYDK